MLKFILKFFKALNSNASPSAVAMGFALGLLMGQYPAGTLQWFVLMILILLVFRVNLAAFSSFLILFALIPPFFHPLADVVGKRILGSGGLESFWTSLYNSPVWYLTGFYNSVIMGFTALFIPLLIILFFILKRFVKLYRNKWKKKIEESKFYKGFKKLPVISKIFKVTSKINWRQ